MPQPRYTYSFALNQDENREFAQLLEKMKARYHSRFGITDLIRKILESKEIKSILERK